jgi:hypothetical protein
MFSKICTLIALGFIGAFALSAMADNGYPNAVLLRQTIKDGTGFDLAMLTDTTTSVPQIDWHQRIKDKMNEWRAAQANGSQASNGTVTSGRSAALKDQTDDANGGATPSAVPKPSRSFPAFD